MATITTYTTLQDAIVEYAGRDQDATFTARVPTFIQMFEAKMNRSLFAAQMEQRSTSTVDTTSDEPEFISLPSDFQSMRSVRLSGVTGKPRLSFMSKTQLDDYRYSIDNVEDQPVYFTIIAGSSEMELAPTPGQNYTLEMVYRKNIPALASNSTNWLLTLAPDLYLYGSLMEAEPYMKNDARVALWAAGYSNALEAVNSLGERQAYDAGPSTVTLPGVVP